MLLVGWMASSAKRLDACQPGRGDEDEKVNLTRVSNTRVSIVWGKKKKNPKQGQVCVPLSLDFIFSIIVLSSVLELCSLYLKLWIQLGLLPSLSSIASIGLKKRSSESQVSTK